MEVTKDLQYECYVTWRFDGGTIGFHGPFDVTKPTSVLVVTGGTGVYYGARGQIVFNVGSACNVGDNQVFTFDACLTY